MQINLLSGPRNISTAMMYSFAQRKDTIVVDEPLYAHYLKITGLHHPGREEVMATQEQDAELVIRNLQQQNAEIVFVKHMTHHLVQTDWNFLLAAKNIIILRHPAKVFQSYHKVIAHPSIDDLGIKQSFALYHYLSVHNAHFIIVDSDDVLKNPEILLRKICSSCEIPFDNNMLEWKSGPIKEDGIWAKYWYENVHQSTGFSAYSPAIISSEIENEPTVIESMKYYNILLQHAIK